MRSRGFFGARRTQRRLAIAAAGWLMAACGALAVEPEPAPRATVLSAPVPVAAPVAVRDASPLLAAQVRAIFQAKCAECHDAATARPKGDFGYVLDLPRVAANRDWVIPGDGEKSELYQLVKTEEMPGDEASSPPLTAEEKEAVKRWIDDGALTETSAVPDPADSPTEASSGNRTNATKAVSPPHTDVVTTNAGATRSKTAAGADMPAHARKLTFLQRLVRALGQFHPPSSHFPIALLIVALPAEFMWQRTRKPTWKAAVRFCVVLGAASAIVTAGLGWCDAAFSNYVGASAPILWWHRWVGTATAVWAAVVAVLSETAHRQGQPRAMRYAFRATLLAGIALVSAAGYLGASLIYGINHFKW